MQLSIIAQSSMSGKKKRRELCILMSVICNLIVKLGLTVIIIINNNLCESLGYLFTCSGLVLYVLNDCFMFPLILHLFY